MSEKKIDVSIIMGVYNQKDRAMLHQAVDSILKQTLTSFEFIICDDGSDPEYAAYIQELQERDQRIRIIGGRVNYGLAHALNDCVRHARGKYLARMDADDISHPERLQKQYAYLEAHPEIAWCGCNAFLIDDNGVWGERKMVEQPQARDYLKYSPFMHPTVMFRREVFEENIAYSVEKDMLRCEDYELFMRLQAKGLRGHNLQESLFYYREDTASFYRRKMQFRISEAKLRYRGFRKLHILFPTGWVYVLRPLVGGILPAQLLAGLKRKESGIGS